MNLTVQNQVVEIFLTPIERIWGCHVSENIEIPLADIQKISGERPENHWRELRAPGTYIPGLIKAGTYYSDQGRAFWYVQRDQDALCLDLKEGYYKRVVLSSPKITEWYTQIQTAMSSLANDCG